MIGPTGVDIVVKGSDSRYVSLCKWVWVARLVLCTYWMLSSLQ